MVFGLMKGVKMAITKIEWAERVWNPITGCTKISLGCR
jgi:protein gp37